MRYFYFFLLCTFSNIATTQEYRPMLQDGAIWNQYFFFKEAQNEINTIIKDTILDNKNYKVILEEPYGVTPALYFFREDTIERKVYERFGENLETLVYDFNLSPGDTFPNRNGVFILDSISNIINNNFDCGIEDTPQLFINNPKIFYFGNNNRLSIIWIEGIGSLAGLRHNTHAWRGGTSGRTLLCHFNKKAERDYHYIYCEEPQPCKGIANDIDPVIDVTLSNEIHVYPIPTSDIISIELNDIYYDKDSYFSIYDIRGQLIKSSKIESRIDVNSLVKGMYVLEFITKNNNKFTHKFIKQ